MENLKNRYSMVPAIEIFLPLLLNSNYSNMDIEYAYARGKLNEQYYNLLNKKIESFVNSNKKKTSDNIKRSPI
jgi:hypothetical protein